MKLPITLAVVAAGLLLTPAFVSGACCMTSLPESAIPGLLTCADGPCPTRLSSKGSFAFVESSVPTACCDVAGNRAVNWLYSGPKGTPGCFWPAANAPAFLRLPCSGNVCDSSVRPHVCSISAEEENKDQPGGERRRSKFRHFF